MRAASFCGMLLLAAVGVIAAIPAVNTPDAVSYFEKADTGSGSRIFEVYKETNNSRLTIVQDVESGYLYYASYTDHNKFVVGGPVLDKDGQPKKGDKR